VNGYAVLLQFVKASEVCWFEHYKQWWPESEGVSSCCGEECTYAHGV